MKKVIIQLIFRKFLLLWMLMHGGISAIFAQNYIQQQVNFTIQVALDDQRHELFGFEAVEYINNSPDSLRFLYFHLWPNGYANNHTELAHQLISSKGKQRLFEDPELRGFIDSLDFKANEETVRWNLLPHQPDVCQIHLNKALASGDTILITTPFHVKIPKGVTSRLGHIGESYQISQWYPKPSVYDQTGWHQFSYQDQGEFYSEFGNYEVSITLPDNYIVGATGELQDESEIVWMNKLATDTTCTIKTESETAHFPPSSVKMKTISFSQSQIHDFAWFADKRFHVRKGNVKLPDSGKSVTTWALFTDQQAEYWVDAVGYVNSSILKFSQWNGDYPYQSFTAVQSALSAGDGMEYPGITVVGSVKDSYSLDEVIAHEVAHSWFYGALGSDERRYPFMDEGITSANEFRYMADQYPHKKLWEVYVNNLKLAKFFKVEQMPVKLMRELEWLSQARDNQEQPLNLAATDYSVLNYSLMIYNKAGKGFDYLRAYLGDSVYDAAMHTYYRQWKFRHPQPDDLHRLFEAQSGKKLDWFFHDFLENIQTMDYKLVRLEGRKLLVKNKGTLVSPFVIAGLKEDSILFKQWVEGFKGERWLEMPSGDFTEFRIDPNHVTPELFRLNNNIRSSGLFPKSDPIHTQLYFSLEDPDKRNLMYFPALNWTRENGLMVGLALHNGFLTPKPFEYFVMPFYAFNNSGPAGFGKIAFNITPYDKIVRKLKISLEGTQFGAPGNQNYHHLKFGTELFFRTAVGINPLMQEMYANFIAASDLSAIQLQQTTQQNYFLQMGYQLGKGGFLNPYQLTVGLESNHTFVKSTAELNYKFSYRGNKNGLDLRLFAGSMLQNSSAIPFYALSASGRSGREQYLFQGTMPDRFAVFPTSLWSRQMAFTEGGLVSPVNEALGYSRWLVSLSLTSTLPGKASRLPVKPFLNLLVNDHGIGPGHGSPVFYEAGLKAGLWNFMEIYFPLLVSGNIQSATGSFDSRIRLVFNLNALNQVKLNSGVGFQIR